MGKKSPSAPAAPDPGVVANAQSSANINTAQAQQRLNMINSYGPDGSVTYQADPNAPGGYAQTTSLSPGQQGLYDLGVRAEKGGLDLANQQIGRIGTALGTPLNAPQMTTQFGPTDFTADREAITTAAFDRARTRLDPLWDTAEDRNRTRLANQGLSQNNDAYQTEQASFGRNRNDAYGLALADAVQQGANEQNTLFGQRQAQATFGNEAAQQNFNNIAYAQNQPINQFNALLNSGQVGSPSPASYTPSQVGMSDVTGAYGLNQAAQNNAYNAAVSNTNANNSGMYGLGTAAITAIAYY